MTISCLYESGRQYGASALLMYITFQLPILLILIPGVEGDELIPDVFNLCAGIQMAVTRHLCQRLQRGMEFVALQSLLPIDNKTLVCI